MSKMTWEAAKTIRPAREVLANDADRKRVITGLRIESPEHGSVWLTLCLYFHAYRDGFREAAFMWYPLEVAFLWERGRPKVKFRNYRKTPSV